MQVTAVTQATIRRIVDGDGALFPRDQASLMPKITAPVQKFYVNRGDHVKQGQLLAVLENRDLIAAASGEQRRGGAGRIQSAHHRRRHRPGIGGQGADRCGIGPRRLATTPRKCWTAGSNCSRRARWHGRLVDESRVAYAQAESQYRAAQEHLRALQSVQRGADQGRRRAGAVRQGAPGLPGSAGRLFAHPQPDRRHRRRPSAQCRRDGQPRRAADHHHGHLARGGARRCSPGGSLRGESGPDRHPHATG